MHKKLTFNFNKDNLFFSGNNFFLIGVFFLPTALPISALFFIVSLIISFYKKNHFSLKDKWNYPFYISIGLIIFSCINILFLNRSEFLIKYDSSLIWLNLFNWIPFVILFCGLQSYLATNTQRIKFAKFLVSGTIPVLFSFISQKFFNWFGPYETLYGLIIWFQKPILINSPKAGLFSNPNYAGIWLALVLPFSLYLFQQSRNNSKSKIITFLVSVLITYSIFLTFSRNAFLGILITLLILLGFRKLFYSLIIFLSIVVIDSFVIPLKNLLPINSSDLSIVDKFMQFNFFSAPRIEIWKSALSRIFERPLWGWGPSTFEHLHIKNNNALEIPKSFVQANHSHNMPLELAHNFGIPLALILVFTIIFLFVFSWKKIYFGYVDLEINRVNKTWFASSLIVLSSHLTDITYYDGKISILISILFAGLRCIINEKSIKSENI